jgi:hypothetical protein
MHCEVSEIICFLKKRNNGRDCSSLTFVYSSMEEISWGFRHRWKILTSYYIWCGVLKGLIWPGVLVNAERISMLCVMWESSAPLGRLLALQEGSAVGWMMKELSISFRQGKSFLSSRQPLRPAQPAVQPVFRVKWLGMEANHFCLSSARVKNVWRCMCHTSTPVYTLT